MGDTRRRPTARSTRRGHIAQPLAAGAGSELGGTVGDLGEDVPPPVVSDVQLAFTGSLNTGDVVDGKYRVGEAIGEGGMGIVYRARDERLERDVAIKVVRIDWAKRDKAQMVFLAEARAMAQVRHPNVVDIYDFGWTGNSPYFVMEYIEGGDLESFMATRGGLLAVDEALGVLDRICRGVAAIHESGAVHRDLKPGNIMIGKGFRVAVADLGLAEVLTATGGEGSWVGSPGFIAPDLLRGERPEAALAARLDIYALGAIAYELLSSQPAFLGNDVDALLYAQSRGEFQPLSEVRPELPAAFDDVIAKAMALHAKDRYASVDEFKRSMHAARHAVTAKAKGRRVVVIDDRAADATLVLRVLRDALPDLRVQAYDDPHEALQAISEDPPSLIITDLRMPEMDGMQVVQSIRMAAKFNHVPIVVMTADGGAREWRELRAAGADGFMVKPIDPVSFRALVDSLLESPMRIRGARDED